MRKKDEFDCSKDLKSLISKSTLEEPNLQSIDLILKQKLEKNLNPFKRKDLEQNDIENLFEKECKITNECNNLKELMSNRDLFEYSLVRRKSVNTNFIRCLDFFRKGLLTRFGDFRGFQESGLFVQFEHECRRNAQFAEKCGT